MKTIVPAFLLSLALAAQAFAGRLSPTLERQLAELGDQEQLRVLVFLVERAGIAELDARLHAERAPMARRHREVIQTLMQAASASQPPLLEELERLAAAGLVSGYTPHWLVNLVVLRAGAEGLRRVAEHPAVEVLVPDFQAELIRPQRSESAGQRQIGLAPGIEAIQADHVWHELGIRGQGAIVADLDTGVDGTHPALSSRWRGNWAPTGECWLDLTQGSPGFPWDGDSHGTHVMGTITGLAPDDSIGAAPGALWIACNGIATNQDFDNGVIAALEWFADPDGDPETSDEVPDVVQNSWGVNESFGYPDCDDLWWEAIDNCEAAGVVLTWSAGNEGPDAETLRSPADRADTPTNCFSVGATYYNAPYNIAGFSSRGPSGCGGPYATKPEVVAPGVSIYSSIPGGYGYMDGTSMAGPHVAGVVGLMRSANPDLDVVSVKQILMDTAVDLGAEGEDDTYGWGIVDAYAAVQAALADRGTLEGLVGDLDTGLPVEGVLVEHLGGTAVTQTDAEGLYRIYLPEGTQQLRFSAFAYLESEHSVEIVAGELHQLDLALGAAPLAALGGVVLDAAGEPLSGAVVAVRETPLPEQTTGPEGAFTFELPVGESWTVWARGAEDPSTQPQGPDSRGYRAFDTADGDWDEVQVPLEAGGADVVLQGENRVIYDWLTLDPDEGGPGTALPFDADDQTLQVDLPFPFVYYGQEYAELSICGNGWLAMGFTADTDYSGYLIPDPADGPPAMLAPFWEDLSPQQPESGNISTYYDEAGGRFIVEFNHVRQFSPATDFESFQAILLDPALHPTSTGDGAFIFQYAEVSNASDCSVGLESPEGLDGLQYWFGRWGGYDQPGGFLPECNLPLETGLAVLYTTGGEGEPVLPPVNDLGITRAGGWMQLAWTPVPGALSYRIEGRSALGESWTERGWTTEASWSTPLVQGCRMFRVVAVN